MRGQFLDKQEVEDLDELVFHKLVGLDIQDFG